MTWKERVVRAIERAAGWWYSTASPSLRKAGDFWRQSKDTFILHLKALGRQAREHIRQWNNDFQKRRGIMLDYVKKMFRNALEKFREWRAGHAVKRFNETAFGHLKATTEKEIKQHTALFWMVVSVVMVLLAAIEAGYSRTHMVVGSETWNVGETILLAHILYIAASLRIIGPSDIGVRLFFGKPIDQVGPGLTFVPFIVCTLRVFSNLVQQAELPAEPELIYRGDEKEDPDGKNVPKGMFPPIRATFDPDGKTDENNPYDQRMVAEVTPVIRYQIVNAVKFVKTIGTWDAARKQIEDTVVGEINEQLSGITPSKALKKLSEINEALEKEIDILVKSWGIDLESIRLKPFGFSHKLNKAVLAIPIAQQQKIATVTAAEATKQEKKLIGEGVAAAEKASLDARTRGLSKMMKDLVLNGHVALGAETARVITANAGQKTIIAGSGGFIDLMGTALAVGENLKSQTPATTPGRTS